MAQILKPQGCLYPEFEHGYKRGLSRLYCGDEVFASYSPVFALAIPVWYAYHIASDALMEMHTSKLSDRGLSLLSDADLSAHLNEIFANAMLFWIERILFNPKPASAEMRSWNEQPYSNQYRS